MEAIVFEAADIAGPRAGGVDNDVTALERSIGQAQTGRAAALDRDRIDARAFAELGAGVGGGVDIGKGELAILDAPIGRHVQREDDFFREHGRELERLARRQLLDIATGCPLPSRTRLQLRAGGVVEGDVEHAVLIVLGIDAALGSEAIDDGIERALARQRKIEKRTGLVRLGLRAD